MENYLTPPAEPRESERIAQLTPDVRKLFMAELVGIADLKAVGVGFGALLFVSFGGFALVESFGWSRNLGGWLFLIGCAAGYIAFREQLQRSATEIEHHDDQMLRVLYDRLERRKQTLIICSAIVLGSVVIGLAIVATRLWV